MILFPVSSRQSINPSISNLSLTKHSISFYSLTDKSNTLHYLCRSWIVTIHFRPHSQKIILCKSIIHNRLQKITGITLIAIFFANSIADMHIFHFIPISQTYSSTSDKLIIYKNSKFLLSIF